ncbi:hypothetical protein [Haloparvum sp. AD34]
MADFVRATGAFQIALFLGGMAAVVASMVTYGLLGSDAAVLVLVISYPPFAYYTYERIV